MIAAEWLVANVLLNETAFPLYDAVVDRWSPSRRRLLHCYAVSQH